MAQSLISYSTRGWKDPWDKDNLNATLKLALVLSLALRHVCLYECVQFQCGSG